MGRGIAPLRVLTRAGRPPRKAFPVPKNSNLTSAAPVESAALSVALAGAGVALAGVAAYARTFSVPFIFDDSTSILENGTIRHLASSLAPAADTTVSGRPVASLSLALDYAFGGTTTPVYHATNLSIHVLAALVLLGIVRRTLALGRNAAALPMAFCVALLWVVHPLNTESVTYVVQRTESLMGFLYLATLYAFIRAASEMGSRGWYVLSVASCFLGMATKEAMASAPLVVLLFDRTFLAGNFRQALGLRWKVYCGLAASWLLLGYLILSTHGRTGTVGFGGSVSSLDYARTQVWAVGHYLKLCLWPSPLVFDYGRALVTSTSDVLMGGFVVATAVAGTLWALVRRPPLGFLGASFLLVLAPSSSFIPIITETVAEHRMYLALVPVIVLGVLALHRWLPRATIPFCCAAAVALFIVTWRRNETYRSPEELWRSVVRAMPANERAHNNLGYLLAGKPGGLDQAIVQYRQALELDPSYAQAHLNLGMALVRQPGRLDEAVAEFRHAIDLNPSLVDAHYNLGVALSATTGRADNAVAEYKATLQLKPDYAQAHFNLGSIYATMPGESDEAIAQYRDALRLKPSLAEAHFNLGCILVQQPGKTQEAIAEFRETLNLEPSYVPALCNLALALNSIGRAGEAITCAADAVKLEPGNTAARRILTSLGGHGR
jgi:tetratricopeptide (TPR) repeat protein